MPEPTLFDSARVCKQCGRSEPQVGFYPAQKSECKDCTRSRVRANRAARREQYSEYERRRTLTPRRKEQMREALRRRRAAHPEKDRARQAVWRALQSGRLVRGPCEVCGTTANVEAHHDDYSRPLDVRWLCFKHHREHAHGQVVVATF